MMKKAPTFFPGSITLQSHGWISWARIAIRAETRALAIRQLPKPIHALETETEEAIVAVVGAAEALIAIGLEWKPLSGTKHAAQNLRLLSKGSPPAESDINRLIDLRSQIVHIGSEDKADYDLHKPHPPEPHPAMEGNTSRLSATFTVEVATWAVDLLMKSLEAVFEAPSVVAAHWAASYVNVLSDLRSLRNEALRKH